MERNSGILQKKSHIFLHIFLIFALFAQKLFKIWFPFFYILSLLTLCDFWNTRGVSERVESDGDYLLI